MPTQSSGLALVVRVPAAKRAFYITKPGFEDGGPAGMKLRIPGDSGETVAFQLAAATARSSIIFSVGDVRRTALDLRLSDPDSALSFSHRSALIRNP
jgi:hypothetical protein